VWARGQSTFHRTSLAARSRCHLASQGCCSQVAPCFGKTRVRSATKLEAQRFPATLNEEAHAARQEENALLVVACTGCLPEEDVVLAA